MVALAFLGTCQQTHKVFKCGPWSWGPLHLSSIELPLIGLQAFKSSQDRPHGGSWPVEYLNDLISPSAEKSRLSRKNTKKYSTEFFSHFLPEVVSLLACGFFWLTGKSENHIWIKWLNFERMDSSGTDFEDENKKVSSGVKNNVFCTDPKLW